MQRFVVQRLQRFDVGRLLALGSGFHVEADLLVLLQRFETTLSANFREVREQVLVAVVRRNETKAFRIVEPLDRASCHLEFLKSKPTRERDPRSVTRGMLASLPVCTKW